MISKQTKHMAQFFASVTEEASKPGLDLTTIRDIYEKLHLAATEPEGVTYAEVDVDGVPALWCTPKGCDANCVLLHSHGGGTVVVSMHLDRKAVGHIAKATGVRALVLDYRRSPEYKFPAQIEDVEKAYHWLLGHGIRPENIATTGQSIGGNFAVSLALALRSKRVVMPAAILSVAPWYDLELDSGTIESNAGTTSFSRGPCWNGFASLGSAALVWRGTIPASICSTPISRGFRQSRYITAIMSSLSAKRSSSRIGQQMLA